MQYTDNDTNWAASVRTTGAHKGQEKETPTACNTHLFRFTYARRSPGKRRRRATMKWLLRRGLCTTRQDWLMHDLTIGSCPLFCDEPSFREE
ncbi:hypothetical protein [Oligosphaera ethanolica]|uniref:Uncharacterized protein n=1 Tax=Oligosphaera ethanolica TaxID=760260 RepID=A0AAE3VFK6_9BACT|nr:hypothetical protein [Oligosphaera ethanolica]MDQ0289440.1 hypothetical protein [Oligosphaera ethanolica]